MMGMPPRLAWGKRCSTKDCFFAFVLGMLGGLYLNVPGAGTVLMIEILGWGVAPFVLLTKWGGMGRYMRRSILWAFAWTAAAVFANALNFHDMRYFIKCVMIISSSWLTMAVAYLFLKKDGKLYLWFLAGGGIAALISLYHFQPGTIAIVEESTGRAAVESLREKERFPYYVTFFFKGLILSTVLLVPKIPVLPIIGGCLFCGFYLLIHGGSRSSFGIYVATAMVAYGINYAKKMSRRMARNTIAVVVVGGLAMAVLFSVYKNMAMSGKLGDQEKKKYQDEYVYVKAGEGGLWGRGGFSATWQTFKRKPWGTGGCFIRHSVISNSWNCEGLIGLLFWLYFFSQVLWFVKRRMMYTWKYSPFIFVTLVGMSFSAVASPFGARSGFFVLMTFIALCRDNPNYGRGTLFSPEMPTRR